MNSKDTSRAILIIDDEVSLRNTFSTFLRRDGYKNVTAVATFDEALHCARNNRFDLIFCDIVLESYSGIELLKKLRNMGLQCPVVLITGYPEVKTASEAVRLGAFDYIPKPVEKETLLKTARLAIAHYQMEQQKREAERKQQQAIHFLETVFTAVSDPIIAVDNKLEILQGNEAAARLLGSSMNDNGGNLERLCSGAGLEDLAKQTRKVLESGNKIMDYRLESTGKEESRLYSVCISPLELTGPEKGRTRGGVAVLRDITYRRSCPKAQNRLHKMLGGSPAMQEVFTLIRHVGKVDTSVLITGPSGTGKELAAHALHMESCRAGKSFVKVDCTAIPDDLLESELFGHKRGAFTGATEDRKGRILQADGGTLFLDEIGDISTAMQLRLLRFLQEKTFYPVGRDKELSVNVRVIAATNADLRERVQAGGFREDLYFRLHVIEIPLPPLQSRRGDVMLLTEHFIHHFAKKTGKAISGISEEAMDHLNSYHWPGNVRELEHVIERACVLCPGSLITHELLSREILHAEETDNMATGTTHGQGNILQFTHPSKNTDKVERILWALQKTGGNKAKAARLLGIDRSTLYRKIHELRIDLDVFSF